MHALLICLSLFAAPIDVREQPLSELVRRSDVVALAHITRVEKIARPQEERKKVRLPGVDPNRVFGRTGEDVRIAEAEVVSLLKGDVSLTKVYFLAESSWQCDNANAELGENALLFLDDANWPGREGPGFRANLASFSGGAPIFDIALAGRGRMPLRKFEDRDYATYWTDVVMPADLTNIDGPEKAYKEIIRSAPLADLETIIRSDVKSQGAMLRVFARRGSCAIWRDDHCLVDQGDGLIAAERDFSSEQCTALWSAFEQEHFLSTLDSLADPSASHASLRIEVRVDGQRRTIRIPDFSEPIALARPGMHDVLRLWLDLLDLVDSPDAKKARAQYRALLSEQR